MSEILLETKNIVKQYGKQRALDDVSMEIKKGSIVGLIGPNGAGKTTLMKVIGGLVYPTEGELSIFGATDEKGLNHGRSRMSFMIESPYLKEAMTARENLEKQRLQKGIPDKKRIDEVLETVDLTNTGKKTVKKFSLGMKQRLGLAIALLGKPEMMILDEPINGLDPDGIAEIRELLLKLNKEEKMTIVISSHILSELSLLCSEYIFMNKGQIIDRLSDEELKNECSDYYRIDTTDNEKASVVLSGSLNISKFDVSGDGSIRIYEGLDRIEEISKALYEAGTVPLELYKNRINLEE